MTDLEPNVTLLPNTTPTVVAIPTSQPTIVAISPPVQVAAEEISTPTVPTGVPTVEHILQATSIPTEIIIPVPAATVISNLTAETTPTSTPTATTTSPPTTPTAVQSVESTVQVTATPTVIIAPVTTGIPIVEPISVPTANITESPTGLITATPTEVDAVQPTIEPTLDPNVSKTEIPGVTQALVPSVLTSLDTLAVSGNFSFISSPTGATVSFDGSGIGTTPITVAVDEGSPTPHSVSMQLSGYQEWASTVDHNPTAGSTETISATLQALPGNGSISVTSTPSGATVALDGASIQTTPYTYSQVTPGSHTVTVSKDGYTPYSTSITVASGAESAVSAVLSPVTTTGSLSVDTYPHGVIVLLNGIVYGTTPAHFNAVPVGSYTMQLVKPGFMTVTRPVDITAGKDTAVQVVLPRWIPQTGTLSIRSFPSGGIVTLDGTARGITPVRIHGLRPDSYNVRVSIPGFMSWIGIVDVGPGRETSIYATLQQKGTVTNMGSISVESTPSGASVVLDSRPQGKTPMSLLNLASGAHSLILTYPGYEPVPATVFVQEGKTSQISVTMTPYQAPNLSPGLITLSDDAAGYFTAHGRSQALVDFNSPTSGFTRDTSYVLALDLNGTILADGMHPSLVGINLSEPVPGSVTPGFLIQSLAATGGGLMYTTNLTIDGKVSLVYVRPAISGTLILTAIPVPDIAPPLLPADHLKMQEQVHSAAVHARDLTREDAEAEIENDRYTSPTGVLLHPFDYASTGDVDQNGVSPTRLFTAVAEYGGGYVWVPTIGGSTRSTSLMPGYAEKVDDTWGIWGSFVEEGHEVIIMMDAVPVSV
ncbi:PEGA domain-containing protein [Methanospirillum sp.]|uniref:PEGA domain-containing protein n=1 Tax=Methanospirillum sp. TaxID=45200 RepID=UPI002611B259|nr:PEGA domain-containing protein [Methanospirillum sp.]